jgi:hypothetical protein
MLGKNARTDGGIPLPFDMTFDAALRVSSRVIRVIRVIRVKSNARFKGGGKSTVGDLFCIGR